VFFKRSAFFGLAFFLLFILVFEHPAFACKCGQTASVQTEFARSDYVFEGRVESVWPKLLHFKLPLFPGIVLYQTYTFRVFHVWKGEVKKESIVLYSYGSECSFIFQPGETYLVYAYRDRNNYNRLSSICTRTTCFSEAGLDLETLGPGKRISFLSSVPFASEPGLRRFCRHLWLHLLSGIFLVWNFSFLDGNLEGYSLPLLILQLSLLVALWIAFRVFFQKRYRGILTASSLVGLFSALGSFFYWQSALIGFLVNLVLLIMFSLFILGKRNRKAGGWLISLAIFFLIFGLLVSGYLLFHDQSFERLIGFLLS
jgi:hypothetical protein